MMKLIKLLSVAYALVYLNVCNAKSHNEWEICLEYKTYANITIFYETGYMSNFIILVDSNSTTSINILDPEAFNSSIMSHALYMSHTISNSIPLYQRLSLWDKLDSEMKNQLMIYSSDLDGKLYEKMDQLKTTVEIKLTSGEHVSIKYLDIIGVFLKTKTEFVGYDYALNIVPEGVIQNTKFVYEPLCFMAFEKSKTVFEVIE